MAEDKALEAAARPSRRQNLGGHLLLGAILLGGLALSLMLGQLDSARRISESRTQATAELATIRAQLEGQILATFSVTEGIVHLLRHDGTITQDHFAGMAAQAIAASPHIRNIGLAPDDVIRYIYPLAGNEKALGLDYRSRPEQYGMVKRAR
ncbi:MAG TPA: hypothetical protein VFK74_07025, partial [Azospira sp.]|nr:hypothetical protein [Azospira sp.]